MKTSWITVCMQNGHVYSLADTMMDKIKEYTHSVCETSTPIPFLAASEASLVYLRPSHITSFHLSTPEVRAKDKEWENLANEVNSWEN
jgi:hypothetical protein